MKLPVPFLQLPVSFDAAALAAEIAALGEAPWRPHPNRLPGNSALTLVTTNGDPDSDERLGPMRATPWLERCPQLMQVMEAIGATWGRSRLMRLAGQAEVNAHVDLDYYWRERMRVHVPIVTQPTVRFICGDAEINMAEGECWIFDTWRLHRVINDDTRHRIHLVADTVGGERFWEMAARGRAPGQADPLGWSLPQMAFDPSRTAQLDYESVNAPLVMTPWELREHLGFLLGETEPHPRLPAVQQVLLRLSRRWHALWSCHGEDAAGWPRYRRLRDATMTELQSAGLAELRMKNQVKLERALHMIVFARVLNGAACGEQPAGNMPAGGMAAA